MIMGRYDVIGTHKKSDVGPHERDSNYTEF